jgi:hypothetical protein
MPSVQGWEKVEKVKALSNFAPIHTEVSKYVHVPLVSEKEKADLGRRSESPPPMLHVKDDRTILRDGLFS